MKEVMMQVLIKQMMKKKNIIGEDDSDDN